MDEQQYKTWWPLHRRFAVGEPLTGEEEIAYRAGLAELEAEEWAERRPAVELLRPLQEQIRELTARNQQLLARELASLGYPGLAYLKKERSYQCKKDHD